MKINLSQSKIQSSLNFREVLQPQSVNKFTLDVCTPSRLLKQSHEFCTQRAEAHLLGATQRKKAYPQPLPKGRVQKILVADMVNAIVSHIKTLRSNRRLLSALCVKIPKDYEIGLG